MGMFDSVYLKIKCPNCSEVTDIECQTKATDCLMNVWRKGDYIGTKNFRWLDCTADCHSDQCKAHQVRKDGYRSGFGRMFNVRVHINKSGIVSGQFEIIDESGKNDLNPAIWGLPKTDSDYVKQLRKSRGLDEDYLKAPVKVSFWGLPSWMKRKPKVDTVLRKQSALILRECLTIRELLGEIGRDLEKIPTSEKLDTVTDKISELLEPEGAFDEKD